MALVAFVLSTAAMLADGVVRTLRRSGSPDVALVLRRGADVETSSVLPAEVVPALVALARTPGRGAPRAIGELVAVLTLDRADGRGFSNVQLRGVPPDAAAFRPSVRLIAGRWPRPGADEVMLGRALEGRFRGLAAGRPFDLRLGRPARVVGLFADGGSAFESEIWAELELTRACLGRPGSISTARVRLPSAADFPAFRAAVARSPLGLEAVRDTDFLDRQSEGLARFVELVGLATALLFGVGAAMGAAVATAGSVAHRRRELATLRALGFSAPSVVAAVLIEVSALALAGGAAGAVASLALVHVRLPSINPASLSEVSFGLAPSAGALLGALAAALLIGAVGGLLPAIQAARAPLLDALRG